jgi:CDP-4-dehydro-6-deoxyglucose reductase
MLERVEQIIEQASFINPDDRNRKSDNQALGARIMSLGSELSRHKRLVSGYRELLAGLRQEMAKGADSARLTAWIDKAEATLEAGDDTIDQSFINETFLRVMSAQATIIPSGHEFFVEGAESLLEAGLRGGLALNYGCSNGNCGLCKLRLVSGETRKIRHHDYSLTEAEKGIGYLLGCCHTAVTDVVLEGDEAQGIGDIPQQSLPIRLKRIERPDPQVLIVSTRTPRTNRLRFLAGQQARLSVDRVGASRYPIASCPCDDMNLQFHIAVDADDPLSAYLADGARVNDVLTLEGPSGAFVLNENSPRSLVFIASGIGFASVKGLIEHAMALDAAERIFLLWIADDDQPPYLHNLCRAWNDALDNFEYRPLPASAAANLDSHLDAELAELETTGFDYYLCGERSLQACFLKFAEGHGLPTHQYLFEDILTRD